jgi:hypothetical protein
MNIFVLDKDPVIAASYHNDRHVVKMILESAQMLSTAHAVLDGKERHCNVGATHHNHPAAVWVRQSTANYEWLWRLGTALLAQFEDRYGHEHSYKRTMAKLAKPPRRMPIDKLTPFAQCLPIPYKRADAVEAYRLYYMNEKYHIAQWKPPSDTPEWWRWTRRARAALAAKEEARQESGART